MAFVPMLISAIFGTMFLVSGLIMIFLVDNRLPFMLKIIGVVMLMSAFVFFYFVYLAYREGKVVKSYFVDATENNDIIKNRLLKEVADDLYQQLKNSPYDMEVSENAIKFLLSPDFKYYNPQVERTDMLVSYTDSNIFQRSSFTIAHHKTSNSLSKSYSAETPITSKDSKSIYIDEYGEVKYIDQDVLNRSLLEFYLKESKKKFQWKSGFGIAAKIGIFSAILGFVVMILSIIMALTK